MPPPPHPAQQTAGAGGGAHNLMGKLTVDPLAIAALAGFGALVAIVLGITIWFIRQSTKKPGEL